MPNPTDRLVRLYGPPALERLHRARVLVIGVGGVGSAAAESLARSGVGTLTLVDPDLVAPSNLNRQIQATADTLGQNKAEALAVRLRRIALDAQIEAVPAKFERSSALPLLARGHDFVVDAIDNLTDKCELIRLCRERKVPLVVSLGAGGRTDPCRVALADLARTRHCPMGAMVRKLLRQRHGLPRSGPFGVPAVYSEELPRPPHGETESMSLVTAHDRESSPDEPASPSSSGRERIVRGTVSFVTGTFGLFCASVVVRRLLELPIAELD